jgi:hypothetical protein
MLHVDTIGLHEEARNTTFHYGSVLAHECLHLFAHEHVAVGGACVAFLFQSQHLS